MQRDTLFDELPTVVCNCPTKYRITRNRMLNTEIHVE